MDTQISTQMPKAADQKFCFSCGQVLHFSAGHCPKCGAVQPPAAASQVVMPFAAVPAASGQARGAIAPHHVFCRGCGDAIHETANSCPKCGAVQNATVASVGMSVGGRDRVSAALLAFFLGGIGAHKFYLGRWVQGIIYLIFCWTFIPAGVAVIEGIVYLASTNEAFNRKYN